MRRIALHEYLSQIEGLVDDNRLPEAAAHCHFVLQQYPRHAGAYRLFGRALLEQQLFDDAIDIFERLLSADPEDLISHAGLALAYRESRDLERALWHMERAFEVDPYNRAIQDELRKLYVARDGDGPARLALTRAALARLHLRAALYQQASAEFTQLVVAYPGRIDLKLALAETLYRDANPVGAADLCREVLATLPYCIKANAIVADVFLSDERIDEARVHLRRVQDLTMLDRARLDPDTTLGQALNNSRISLPESVQVEVLEDTLAFAKGFEESGAWPESATAVVVDGESLPDWLQDLGSPDSSPALESPMEANEEPEPAEMMDWLEEVRTTSSDVSTEIDVESTPSLVEAVEGTTAGAELNAASELSKPLPLTDDSLEAVLRDAESAEENGLEFEAFQSSATSQDLDDIANEPAAEAHEGEAPIWENERLLALDELRSYIDSDSEPRSAGGSAPEWLDELADRSDVTDELPRWLHEAVGFDVSESSAADILNPQMRDDDTPESGGRQGDNFVIQEEPFEPDITDSGKVDDDREGEVGFTEGRLQDEAHRSNVPDWLIESDDVLDELPGDLLQVTVEDSGPGDGADDDTMTWLDELSEQLAEGNGGASAQDASPGEDQENEVDEPPTDAILE